MTPECSACWEEARALARFSRGRIPLHTLYQQTLDRHDRAADRGEETPDHA